MTDQEREKIERQREAGFDWYRCRECGAICFAAFDRFEAVVLMRENDVSRV